MDEYWFYVPDLLGQAAEGSGGVVRLPEDQGHHARAVLRLEAGEGVVVFDGRGAWAEGKIGGEGRGKGREVAVELIGGVRVDAAAGVRLTIATAVPKGERAEWLVEQASQLDVAVVQWLDCDRGVVKPREGGQKIEKWRRLAVESAKQCGRTHVMRVEEPARVEKILEKVGEGSRVLWLEPREGGRSKRVGEALVGFGRGEAVALVGPEGGWSEREHGLLEGLAEQGKLERVRLTRTVLRIETACAAIAGIVMGG